MWRRRRRERRWSSGGREGKEREKQTSLLKDHATQRQLFLQKVLMATLVKNRQKQLYYATVRETFGYWQFFIAARTKCSPSESDLLASDGVLQKK